MNNPAPNTQFFDEIESNFLALMHSTREEVTVWAQQMIASRDKMFHRYPVRSGSAWLKYLPEDERRTFARIGYDACLIKNIPVASIGGTARAQTARRIPRGERGAGRFTSNSKETYYG